MGEAGEARAEPAPIALLKIGIIAVIIILVVLNGVKEIKYSARKRNNLESTRQ